MDSIREEKRREEKITTSGCASKSQSKSFIEWCLFLKEKTGTGQCWNQRYKATWNRFIEEFSIEVMIGLLDDREFTKVEYVIEGLNALKKSQHRLYIECVSREKYWAIQKVMFAEALEIGAEKTGVKNLWGKPKRPKYSHVNALIKIQAKFGLRSPEAVKYARKWNMQIEGMAT